MAEAPDRFQNPPSYPAGGTFGQLLHWHLDWGTMPNCSTSKRNPKWILISFAKSVHRHESLSDNGKKNIYNWSTGSKIPDAKDQHRVDRIYSLLFGSDPNLQNWKRDMESALEKARQGLAIKNLEANVAVIFDPLLHASPTPNLTGHSEGRRRASEARDKVDGIIDKLASSFVGRSADLAKINDFVDARMAGGAEGLLAITAPAGFGKSALAASWCKIEGIKPNRHIARHFCFFSGGQATNSPENIRAHLHQQVADLLGQSMDVSLINLLKSPPPDDEQLVVWLDGIDEADDTKSDVIGFLPKKELGERICLIVSARADKDVTPAYLDPWLNQGEENSYKPKRAVHLDKLPFPDVERLVDSVFARAEIDAPKGLARRIFKASEQGYALFASIMADTALEDVQHGREVDLGKEPVSLRNYAESELTRLGKLSEWRDLKSLFSLLIIAKDALTLDEAEILLGNGEEIFPESFPNGFSRWLSIIEASDCHPMRLSFAHPKLAEVFGQELDRQRGRHQALTKFCETITAHPYSCWPSYAWRHFLKHLLDADEPFQAADLLIDLAFINARFAALGAEATPPLMAADWMTWYSIVRRKITKSPSDAMRHLRFWNNYATRLSNAASDGVDDAWRQLMGDVGLAPTVMHAGLTRPRPDMLPMSLATLRGHQGSVYGALALADGAGFLSWSGDKTLRLWGPNGEPGAVLGEHEDSVLGALALADDAGFLSWSRDKNLRFWGLGGERGAVLSGHEELVRGAVALADGRSFLSWGGDNTLWLWGPSGEATAILHDHEDDVLGALALADGAGFLSWSKDKTLRLWGLRGERGPVLSGHEGLVNSALALADGKGFLSWSNDKTLRLWGPGGERDAVLNGHDDAVKGALELADGAGFLSWSWDKTLRLWEPGGERNTVLSGHEDVVEGALALADGAGFLSWSSDKTLRLWGPGGERGPVLSGHEDAVKGALELSDGAGFLSWSSDKTLRFWGPGGKPGAVLRGHDSFVSGALALADGASFLSWSLDHTLRIWGPGSEPSLALREHGDLLEGALALADGAGFLSWSVDSTLRLWGPRGEPGEVLRGHERSVSGALALDGGAGFLSWSKDGTLRLWGPCGQPGEVLRSHRYEVRGALVLADGAGFLSWSKDGTLRLWGPHGELGEALRGHGDGVQGVLVLADRAGFLSWSLDHTLRLWGPRGEPGDFLRGHSDWVHGALALADGGGFLSWSGDCTLRFWGPRGEPGKVLCGHEGPVVGALALGDGETFLSWSWDGSVRLWGPGGKTNAVLCRHEDSIYGVLALADKAGFLSWGRDGRLNLWSWQGELNNVWLSPAGAISHVEPFGEDDQYLVVSGGYVGIVGLSHSRN